MSQETSPSRYPVPRTRRIYSVQFKAELIAACLQPGASIAVTAREHGMNANVLHRWLKEHRLGRHQIACDKAHADVYDIAAHDEDVFANAVLFNVPSQALPQVLRQLHACLRPGGVLFNSNPRGAGQEAGTGSVMAFFTTGPLGALW